MEHGRMQKGVGGADKRLPATTTENVHQTHWIGQRDAIAKSKRNVGVSLDESQSQDGKVLFGINKGDKGESKMTEMLH